MYSMANEPIDMIIPMLREMRSEIRDLRNDMKAEFGNVRQRLEMVEGEIKNVHKALIADTLLSKLVSADFDGRIAALEINVEALMKGT
jgi:hypothetical protein